MASSIPEDTLRRLKNPVIAEEQADGTILYRERPRVLTGDAAMIPNLHTDRGSAGVTKAPPARGDDGKFA